MHDLQTYITFLYFIIILIFLGFACVEFIFLDVRYFVITHSDS